MSTLSFGYVQVFTETLEFELGRLRRQAEHERMLRSLQADRVQPRRTDRPTWRHPWPGTPHSSGTH